MNGKLLTEAFGSLQTLRERQKVCLLTWHLQEDENRRKMKINYISLFSKNLNTSLRHLHCAANFL